MKLFKRIVVFLITLLISIFVLDYFFLASGISNRSYYKNDPIMGSAYLPDAEVLVLNEGFYIDKINKAGFFGEYHEVVKPSNCFRIALFGDSFTEGMQVFEKYHFSSIMQGNIHIDTLNTEVINCGRGGYGFELMYIFYKEKIKNYNPDLILFFLTNNNIVKKSRNLFPSIKLKNDSLYIERNFNDSEEYKNMESPSVLRGMASYGMLQKVKDKIIRKRITELLLGKIYYKFLSGELKHKKVDWYKILINYDTSILHKIIDDLNRISSLHKTKFIFVLNEKFPMEIMEIFSNRNVNIVDLTIPLRNAYENAGDPFYWSATNKYGHWNHIGHKYIGEYLSKEITKLYKQPLHISSNVD